MLKRFLNWVRRNSLRLATMALLPVLLPRVITGIYAANRIYPESESPTERVAIIFGAGLRRDGTPTAMLRDRVLTGADLYFSGKVEKLLMSGDNRFENSGLCGQAHLRYLLPCQSHLWCGKRHFGNPEIPSAARHVPV